MLLLLLLLMYLPLTTTESGSIIALLLQAHVMCLIRVPLLFRHRIQTTTTNIYHLIWHSVRICMCNIYTWRDNFRNHSFFSDLLFIILDKNSKRKKLMLEWNGRTLLAADCVEKQRQRQSYFTTESKVRKKRYKHEDKVCWWWNCDVKEMMKKKEEIFYTQINISHFVYVSTRQHTNKPYKAEKEPYITHSLFSCYAIFFSLNKIRGKHENVNGTKRTR